MPDEREDQIFSLRDENLALKKKLKANDDNTKKLLVKLNKLNEQINKGNPKDADYISSLKEQIQSLSTNSSHLKTKLSYYKALHESETRKRTAYSHIPPRVETSKKTIAEIESYSNEIEVQKETIQELQEMTNKYRLKITSLDNEVKKGEQDIQNLQETVNEYSNLISRIKKAADIDRISLQQELNETKKLLIDQRAKNDLLDEQFRNVSKSFKEVTAKAEELSKELNVERQKSLGLEKQLSEEKSKLEAQDEFHIIIQDLRKEKSLLEAELDVMMKNRFATERDGEFQEEINNLKRILDEERKKYDSLYQEKLSLQHTNADLLAQSSKDSLQRQKLESEFYEKQNEIDELRVKLNQLSRTLEKQPSPGEMEEAFALLRLKKETGLTFEFLSNLHNFEKDNEAINELRQEYAACVLELEGANNLLKMQKKINDDLNNELSGIKKKLQVITGEYEIMLAQQIELVKIEKHKVEYLEEKLRNSVPFESIPKQPLENISGGSQLELVIHGAIYNSSILSYLNKKSDIGTFEGLTTILLVDFYDFETSLMRFNLNVDEKFLYYFQTQKMSFTVCQTDGIDFFVLGKSIPTFPSFISGQISSEKFSSDITTLEKKILGKLEYTININMTLPKYTEYNENTIALNLQYPEYSENINASRADPNVLCVEVIRAAFISEVDNPRITGVVHFPPTKRDVEIPEISGTLEPTFNFKTFLPITIIFADANLEDHLYGTVKIPAIELCTGAIDGQFDVENLYGIKCGSVDIKIKWETPYFFQIKTVLDKEKEKVVSQAEPQASPPKPQMVDEKNVKVESSPMQPQISQKPEKQEDEIDEESDQSSVQSIAIDDTDNSLSNTKDFDEQILQFNVLYIQFYFDNPKVQELLKKTSQIFVGVEFIGLPGEEMETQSIPLTKQEKTVVNYVKSISSPNVGYKFKQIIDKSQFGRNILNYSLDMLLSIVDEPPESDAERDCVDLGHANLKYLESMENSAVYHLPIETNTGLEFGKIVVQLNGLQKFISWIKN
ncbi:Protein fantom [Boothiomyces sp. JEL0866]|nr:Protein fantom [Boothiomyces sp. JEL0866]